ncbi:MAG: glycosyltransferase family 2 protein [Candidatus Omnitrophica bacterium]|nr:glycosyltransferase family 2 protein [Candidatus Omnitrophota bacterium]
MRGVLDAIKNQTTPDSLYEVIVLTLCSHDNSNKIIFDEIKTYRKQFRGIQIFESRSDDWGEAVNAALFRAKGKIVLFLDDQCEFSEELFEKTIDTHARNPDVGIIGGPVTIQTSETREETYSFQSNTRNASLEAAPDLLDCRNWLSLPTALNWSAKSKALRRIGGFRRNYPLNSDFAPGAETVVGLSMRRLGIRIALDWDLPVVKTRVDFLNSLKSAWLAERSRQDSIHQMVCERRITSPSAFPSLLWQSIFKVLMSLRPYPVGTERRYQSLAEGLGYLYYAQKRLALYFNRIRFYWLYYFNK